MDGSQEWRAWLPKGLWGQAIVTLLLEQPVKPDIESRCQGPWEVTPLQQAGYHGRAECAKILLRHGASTTSRSGPGCGHKTAKEIAEQMHNGQWQELIAAIDGSDAHVCAQRLYETNAAKRMAVKRPRGVLKTLWDALRSGYDTFGRGVFSTLGGALKISGLKCCIVRRFELFWRDVFLRNLPRPRRGHNTVFHSIQVQRK